MRCRSACRLRHRHACPVPVERGAHLTLQGLPADDAVLLLERTIERPLEAAERAAAEHLCAALEGHPLRILQAAALARERGISLDGWARDIRPEILLTALLASIDEKQRRALLALTALRGVPLAAQEISGLAEVTDIEPSLTALARLGLVVGSHGRYQLADGVADRLRRREDLKPWVNRAITYFTAWAERHHRNPTRCCTNPWRSCRRSSTPRTHDAGEKSFDSAGFSTALSSSARGGAPGRSHSIVAWPAPRPRVTGRPKRGRFINSALERSVSAKRVSRARCWARPSSCARRCPTTPRPRPAGAISVSSSSPVAKPSPAASKTLVDDPLDPLDLDALPLRAPSPAVRAPTTTSYGLLIVLLSAVVGWLAYLAVDRGPGSLPFQRRPTAASARVTSSPVEAVQTAGSSPVLETAAELPPLATATPTTGPASLGPGPESSSILIFTARPGSIATPRSTQLCYAVSGARQARIEPGVGDVHPTSTLSCRRVAPPRTTTYELTAYGRDGQHAKQQLVVVVR